MKVPETCALCPSGTDQHLNWTIVLPWTEYEKPTVTCVSLHNN